MGKRTHSEADRDRELHRLLDAIPVPDDASNSDLSSELASNFGREPQSFIQQKSPEAREIEYFGGSLSSTINGNSVNSKSLRFDDDSQLDMSRNSQIGAFTPQQVSKMMDWSRNYVLPADGLFPQVSAASISIDPDDHLFGRSDQASPHESYFNPTSIPMSRAASSSMKESIGASYERNDRSSQRTGSERSRPPRKALPAYSPSNAQDANWFYTPGSQPQKRQADTISHRSHGRSSASSDFVNQGSALLSLHHVGCQPLQTETSLALNREQITEDMHKLMRELTILKIENKGLKDNAEICSHEIEGIREAYQELEYCNQQLRQAKAELEEHLNLTQAHNKGTLEQFRGRALELARTEMAQLKNSIAERDKKISELRQALSAKNFGESAGTKSKEIDDLTMELTRLKIHNSSLTKQHSESRALLKKERNHRDHLQQELDKANEMLKDAQDHSEAVLCQKVAEITEKQNCIDRLHSSLKEAEGTLKLWNEAKNREKDDLNQLKEAFHMLQCENQDLKHWKTSEYEGQMNKLKVSYEQRLHDASEQFADAKGKLKAQEDRNAALEEDLIKAVEAASDKENIMEKEITIEILTNDRERLIKEVEILHTRTEDLREQLATSNSEAVQLREELNAEADDTKSLRQLLERERRQLQDRLACHEDRQSELNKTIKTLQDEVTKAREETRVQAEAAQLAHGSCMKLEDEVLLYREKLATFGPQSKTERGVVTSFDLPIMLSTGSLQLERSLDHSESKDYVGMLEAKEIEIDQLFREKQYYEGEAKQLKDTVENLQNALRDLDEEAPKVPCSTQTCNDLLAELRSAVMNELDAPTTDEHTQQLKLALDELRDQLEQDTAQRLEEAEANYTAKYADLEGEYRANFKVLQRDYEEEIKAKDIAHTRAIASLSLKVEDKDAEVSKLLKVKASLDVAVHDLKLKCSDLEAQIANKLNASVAEADLRKKFIELEKVYKAKLRDLEHMSDMEKLQLTQSLQKSEEARLKLERQNTATGKQIETLKSKLLKLEDLDTQLKLKFDPDSYSLDSILGLLQNFSSAVEAGRVDRLEVKGLRIVGLEKPSVSNSLEAGLTDLCTPMQRSAGKRCVCQENQSRVLGDAPLETLEAKHAHELASLNDRLTRDYHNKEKTLRDELYEAKRLHAVEVQEMQKDYEDQLEDERRRYKELLNVKSSHDNSQVEDDSATELEHQWQQRLDFMEKTLKSQFANDLLDKEQAWCMATEESQARHAIELKTLEDKLGSLRLKHKESLEQLKDDHLKAKKELERELRMAKELLEKASESARKDTELLERECVTIERREADRKLKQKTMLLQHKHAKELQDRETALKQAFDKEKADALKALSDTHKKALKLKETELTRKLEDNLNEAVSIKLKETEIKVRKELKEQHIIELGKLDMEHLAQREKIREQLMSEYEKRMHEWKRTSMSQHASFYDLPVRQGDRSNTSLLHFQDSMFIDFEADSKHNSPADRKHEFLKEANRSNMMVEDMRSRQAFELKLQSPDKEYTQNFVTLMCDLARKDEADQIARFLSSELEAYLSGSPTMDTSYPIIKQLMQGYLTRLSKLTVASPRVRIPLEPVRMPRVQSCIEYSTDKNFLKYDQSDYIAAGKVIADLEELKSAFLSALSKQSSINFPCKSARKATGQPQVDYRDLTQILWKLVSEVQGTVRRNMEDSRVTDGNEAVRLRLVIAEQRDKVMRYEKELKNLTVEYKTFIIKTNDRIQRLGTDKQATEQLLNVLTSKLKSAEAKIIRLEETPVLSPEMLSPEETVQLVISVLKRSSRDCLLSQLLYCRLSVGSKCARSLYSASCQINWHLNFEP